MVDYQFLVTENYNGELGLRIEMYSYDDDTYGLGGTHFETEAVLFLNQKELGQLLDLIFREFEDRGIEL